MSSEPRILAFDTSGPHCAAALLIGQTIAAQRHAAMARGQAEQLMPMLDAVLGEVGTGWQDLDAVAVGIGPGNFTGLRIAIAAARGLAMALDIPAIGVTGFEALRSPDRFGDPAPQIVSLPPGRRGVAAVLQRFAAGRAVGEPIEFHTPDVPGQASGIARGEGVFGYCADAIDSDLYGDRQERPPPVECEFGWNRAHGLVASIARVAALKLHSGAALPPPAPVYIRPPDAALPDTPPPAILP
ncbi:MAG TPA: tRNA (adenosine(37)-N6)-threonylcarbamoyltransferase complex dimerization subunit type 1 TsaB [Rhodobacteraceae bacterium]|nr:tRNA (adenosine(37)-N6)-threonylcarbamoyltransferase complex dimerization subunit type 1 TsaB [Paracoccaceae bacterium]HBG98968.1 tRNA (adenosine(37)-N6)-threonylcarbamoyltransferase complex dimerization subunit type 1 TsaB [Paracoccaceae bacterium]